MEIGGAVGRKILLLAVMTSVAAGWCAAADNPATVIESLGLIGTWASYCTAGEGGKPGLRIVFAEPPGGAPTFTTVSSDGSVTTTINSAVLAAEPVGAGQIRLRLRIIGGDVDGGPLPSPTTNTFERTIERVGDHIRLLGTARQSVRKCRL
jgi:hypothetical protein